MKVGVITMFYGSSNYGGILQAYALTKAIEKEGDKAEQICYNNFSVFSYKGRVKRHLAPFIRMLRKPTKSILYLKILRRSRIVTRSAEKLVPHSKGKYTEKSINRCLANYDAFVTGSDQVWHGEWPAYFLTFVPTGRKKISYAASTGKTELSEKDIKQIKENTDDFSAISVREVDTQRILKSHIVKKDIEIVLDPTLILDRGDWDKICSPKRIHDSYVFCYFLGSDERMRNLARQYAVAHGMKVVSIPHMQGVLEKNDLLYADVQIFNATPQDFISLIKYAAIVFTDSFHATVFSHIYGVRFVSFGRMEHKEMNNRLVTLTEMFGTSKRFIADENQLNLEHINEVASEPFFSTQEEYNKLKKESLEYLYNSLHE